MRARGFTLVEVMVALAVVAVALPALLVALDQQIDNTGYLRDKTLAQMVASNKLAEARLKVAATRNLKKGKDDGIVAMADRDWFWRSEIKTTEVANYFRVEISVAAQEGDKVDPLYTLVGFMSGDLQGDPGGSARLQGGNGGNGGGNGGGSGGGNGGSMLPGGSNVNGIDIGDQLNEASQQSNEPPARFHPGGGADRTVHYRLRLHGGLQQHQQCDQRGGEPARQCRPHLRGESRHDADFP